jgi:cytochrome c-type biogenesis protein CcmE
MRKNLALLLSAVVLAGVVAGCVSTNTGEVRYGIPLQKASLESRYQRPVPQIFAAARQVLEMNGTLAKENTINHSLEAKVDNRTVIVIVDEVEPGVSRVRTEARKKAGNADLDLAAEIDKQIALRLK